MADETDQQTRFRSLPDLVTYQVLFKSVHNYGRYRMTKNSIYIYIYIYHLFNGGWFWDRGVMIGENISKFSGSLEPRSNAIGSFLSF